MSILGSLVGDTASTYNARRYGKIVAVMPRAVCTSRGRSSLLGGPTVVSVAPGEKPCKRCGIVKPLEAFSADKRLKDGRINACRDCHTAVRRERYASDPEPYREQVRARRRSAGDHVRAKDRENYAAQPEIKRAIRRRSYYAHAQARKQQIMAYRRANPLKVALIEQKRRAQRAGAPGGITDTQWLSLCALYGERCLACGRSDVPLTLDHVIPLSRGGSHCIANAQPLCKPCNSSKGTQTIDYRPAEVSG